MKAALVLLGAAVALIAAGVGFAYLVPESTASDDELASLGFVALSEPAPVIPFELTDARGESFAAERLRERWSFVFFGYANCPDICPTTMAVLGDAEQQMLDAGDEAFQGVLVSVDPERDTPEALASYLGAFSPNFVGVTGPAPRIQSLAKSLHAGFAKVPVEDSALGYLMDHSSHLAVIDPQGRHYGYVRPPFEARRLASLTRSLHERWRVETG